MSSASLRDNLMSDVRRIVYALDLHQVAPKGCANPMDIEISRRLFWEAYVIDKSVTYLPYPSITVNGSPCSQDKCDERETHRDPRY